MLFDQYHNEADFRAQFVKPFLLKMGFFNVVETHGTQEFGLDFVCSELHRVFGVRTYGVVVKHEQKINQSVSVLDDVLRQVEQAFSHEIKHVEHGNGPQESRAAIVMVLNSGEITANARKRIGERIAHDRYGANVIVLSGEQLESIANFSQAHDIREITEFIEGLRGQLNVTRSILQSSIATFQQPTPVWSQPPLPMHMIEAVFARPRVMRALGGSEWLQVWERLSRIHSVTSNLQNVLTALKDEKGRQAFTEAYENAFQSTTVLVARCEALLAGNLLDFLTPGSGILWATPEGADIARFNMPSPSINPPPAAPKK